VATEIQQNYHQGDRVILAGRLGMHTVERQEGFKEKRAELTVQQIQSLGSSSSPSPITITPSVTSTPPKPSSPVFSSSQQEVEFPPVTAPVTTGVDVAPEQTNYTPTPLPQSFEGSTYSPLPEQEPDPDDIPFVRAIDSITAKIGLLDSYEIESQCPQVGISHNFKFI
jgi:single-stranded DNA-binding protein